MAGAIVISQKAQRWAKENGYGTHLDAASELVDIWRTYARFGIYYRDLTPEQLQLRIDQTEAKLMKLRQIKQLLGAVGSG